MINLKTKSRRAIVFLFCLSFCLVITVSCAVAPAVITLAKINSAVNNIEILINASEKTLYTVSNLVNFAYGKLGEDIKSEDFKAMSKFPNDTIQKMEARHSELDTTRKELDDSLSKTNTAANDLFSMLETRANQNSQDSLRKDLLRDIGLKKEDFSAKIRVAYDVSSKLKISIKDYDDILIVFQVRVGLDEAQKYLNIVDSTISRYTLLEQEVQVALRDGRRIIANIADTPSSPTPSESISPRPSEPVPSPEFSSSQTDRPILGVKVASLTEDLRQQINQDKSSSISINVDKGVLVVGVEKDYPAYKSGIQIGDVIVKINARTVVNHDEFMDEIKKMQVGMELPLEVYRGQQKLEVLVNLK
jgi:PDZ domain